MLSLGTSSNRISSVTVPMLTMTLESLSAALSVSFTILDSERGGRLVLER